MRDGAKNDIVLYSKIFQKFIGPDMFFWVRHCVAVVCALQSALLVYLFIGFICSILTVESGIHGGKKPHQEILFSSFSDIEGLWRGTAGVRAFISTSAAAVCSQRVSNPHYIARLPQDPAHSCARACTSLFFSQSLFSFIPTRFLILQKLPVLAG